MSEQAILAVVGLLISALFAVGGFVIRAMWAKLMVLEEAAVEFAAFMARLDSTEHAWESWREAFSAADTRRRAEIDKRLDSHAEDIKTSVNRLTKLERNGD